jgi:hypothetical protein
MRSRDDEVVVSSWEHGVRHLLEIQDGGTNLRWWLWHSRSAQINFVCTALKNFPAPFLKRAQWSKIFIQSEVQAFQNIILEAVLGQACSFQFFRALHKFSAFDGSLLDRLGNN